MKLPKLLAFFIVVLGLLNVTFSNHSLDDSSLVADLSVEIGQLERDNTILKSRIAEAGAIKNLHEVIAGSGFVETPKIVTLSPASQVASR